MTPLDPQYDHPILDAKIAQRVQERRAQLTTNEEYNEMSYNGWTNYATWAVGMYLDGNYTGDGTYLDVLEIAEDADTAYELATALEDWFENEHAIPELDGIAADLLSSATIEINWQEIAEVKLAEVKLAEVKDD